MGLVYDTDDAVKQSKKFKKHISRVIFIQVETTTCLMDVP